jgi:hypothetical protein
MKQFETIQDLTGAIYYDMLPKISTGYNTWDEADCDTANTEDHITETMTAIESTLNLLGWNDIDYIEVCTVESSDEDDEYIVFSEAQSTVDEVQQLLNDAGYDNIKFVPDLFLKYKDEHIVYHGWTSISVYKNDKILMIDDVDCGGGQFAIKFK